MALVSSNTCFSVANELNGQEWRLGGMTKRNTGALVMIAVMAFGLLVACGGLGLALLYEADERALSNLDAAIASHKADTAAAIRAARPVLSQYGITEVSDDTLAARMDDG